MLGPVTTPQNLDERFRDAVSALQPSGSRRTPDEPVRDGTTLTGTRASELFDAQLTSRHLDLAARWLRSFNEGFHTIGSSGHEGNAAVAAALRPDDPALLHYRSGGFYCVRAAQAAPPDVPDDTDVPDPLVEAARDVLRGIVASAREPIAGGRHKVFGRADLHIVPTTSTIASHLPRAVGLAFGLSRPGGSSPWPADATPPRSTSRAAAVSASGPVAAARARKNAADR